MNPLRIGLVGYGAGGRLFHAPYIAAAQGITLAGVVTHNPQRRAEVAQDYPGLPVYDTLDALLDAGVDAVTITTPPQTRRELVLRALARGVHVVADKPFAPSAEDARALQAAALAAGRQLAVFHNRRWDTDVRTLRAVIDSGRLGNLSRVESRFELDEPASLDAGPQGGLLRDLGTHLVDQMMWLLGPVDSVYAELDYVDLPGGRTDAAFNVSLTHTSGVRSRVSAGKLNRLFEKSWRAYGNLGSYVASGTDVQTAAIKAGRRPASEGAAWGFEDKADWGTLRTAAGEERVPSARGAYQDFYTAFANAVAGKGMLPVTAADGIRLLEVLDAARLSAAKGQRVSIAGVTV